LPVRGEVGGPEADSEERSSDEGPLFSRDQSAVERAATGDAAAPPWQQEVLRERSRGSSPPVETPVEPVAEPKRRNLLFSSSRRERERAAAERASETTDRDQTTLAPETTAADTSRPTFEDAWPQIDRTRSDSLRRPPRTPSTFRDAEIEPPRHDVAAEVTVLKSGVVDGMAYSLYSDGSIEAQMPEGMMRFASIDELREHLDQRA
jgi:hypothetical protein